MDAHHHFLVLGDRGDDFLIGNLSWFGFLSPGIETEWQKDQGLFMLLAFERNVISIVKRCRLFGAVVVA